MQTTTSSASFARVKIAVISRRKLSKEEALTSPSNNTTKALFSVPSSSLFCSSSPVFESRSAFFCSFLAFLFFFDSSLASCFLAFLTRSESITLDSSEYFRSLIRSFSLCMLNRPSLVLDCPRELKLAREDITTRRATTTVTAWAKNIKYSNKKSI